MERRTADSKICFDDEGTGPALVLLHAFPLSRAMWKSQRAVLSRSARVITPDLPGFGDSKLLSGRPTIAGMADAIAALLDELAIGEVIMGGLSMGGYVALAFARKYRQRLRGLILADTKAEADDDAAKAGRDKMIALASTNPSSAVLEQMLPRLLCEKTREQRPEIVAELRQLASTQSSPGIVAGLQAMRDRPDSTSILATLDLPALVITGSEDAFATPEASRRMAEALPRGRFEIIEGAGHLSNLEQAERFSEVVQGFLDEASGGR